MPALPNGAQKGERRLRLILVLLLIGLAAFTLVVFLTPILAVSIISLPLDLIINTGAMLVAGAVAGLAWMRYRETREARSLLQSAAFLTLASVNALVLATAAAGTADRWGFSLDDPGSLPVLVFMAPRFVAAGLLLAAGWLALRGNDRSTTSGLVALVPAAIVIALLSVFARTDLANVRLMSPQAIQHLRTNPGDPLPLSSVSPGLLVTQLVIGALFLVAAWLAYRTRIRDGRPSDGYLAAGLVVAAFSQIHFAANPGSYVALVTTGDVLRVAFYGILLAGIFVQSRTDTRQLRAANVQLEILRDAEVHRATLEERARLAREVHDGLAQDLWFARLKQGRLLQLVQTDQERGIAQEVVEAIDSGLADARQAVMAMRAGSTDAPLFDLLRGYLDDFGDRYALRATLETDGEQPELSARAQAEILRIVQEALNNTRKHADATAVTVRASTDDGMFRIVVADNGRGFAAGEEHWGFGLMGMRERAELIGARVDVQSAVQDGTRVVLTLRASGRATA